MSKQSRFFSITVNNPSQNDDSNQTTYTYEQFKEKLTKLYDSEKIQFASFQEEEAPSTGTHHFQGYIEFTKKITFPGVHKLFNNKKIQLFPIGIRHGVPFDQQRQDARNYSKKKEKQGVEQIVINPPFEVGQFEENIVGNHSWEAVYQTIQEGKPLEEVLAMYPEKAVVYRSHIERAIQQQSLTALNSDRTPEKFKVIYIHGAPGSGKSSYVAYKHGYENVYEINASNYADPFFSYSGQPVLILDEFSIQNLREKITIQDLLKICDFQPYKPNIRYSQVVARWSVVYIISNQSLASQLQNLMAIPQTVIDAFTSRINQVLYKESFDKPFVDLSHKYKGKINNRIKAMPNFDIVEKGE